MAPLPHDQDITSWPQLLSAIEDAEAGQGTARLTEICLSVYSALAAAQFQITQLKARVHVLATSKLCPHGDPMTVSGSRLPPPARITKQPGRGHHGSAGRRAAGPRHDRERDADHDQKLGAAFAAFTRFASGTRMPRPEWLTGWRRLITAGAAGALAYSAQVVLCVVAVACNKRRKALRSAATMPPHTPCWPISQCRSDSVRHWTRTGHVVQTAIAAAAS